MIAEYADRHHKYIHDVVEYATIEDLTVMSALSQLRSEEEDQRQSMARTKAAARAQR